MLSLIASTRIFTPRHVSIAPCRSIHRSQSVRDAALPAIQNVQKNTSEPPKLNISKASQSSRFNQIAVFIALTASIQLIKKIDELIDDSKLKEHNEMLLECKDSNSWQEQLKLCHYLKRIVHRATAKDILLMLVHFPDQKIFLEKEIQKVLIEERKINLIYSIFPWFSPCTLQDAGLFDQPIKNGDLKLIKAMCETGMIPQQPEDQSQLLLQANECGQIMVAVYFVTLYFPPSPHTLDHYYLNQHEIPHSPVRNDERSEE